jgi:hypothetical protein
MGCWRLSAAMLFVVLVSGCGDKNKAEVQGTVKLDGTPLDQGGILFIPTGDTKGPSTGASIMAGSYKVDRGVIIGKNRVEIRAAGKSGKKAPSLTKKGVMIDEYIEIVPDKYNRTTELAKEVQPGSNTFDFDLKTK